MNAFISLIISGLVWPIWSGYCNSKIENEFHTSFDNERFTIQDLKVEGMEIDAKLVTLSWTREMSREADEKSGSTNFVIFASTDLSFSTNNLIRVNQDANETEEGFFKVTVKIPDELWNASILYSKETEAFPLLFFTVHFQFSNGSLSERSNIASTGKLAKAWQDLDFIPFDFYTVCLYLLFISFVVAAIELLCENMLRLVSPF